MAPLAVRSFRLEHRQVRAKDKRKKHDRVFLLSAAMLGLLERRCLLTSDFAQDDDAASDIRRGAGKGMRQGNVTR
jgi:hypothetical protein